MLEKIYENFTTIITFLIICIVMNISLGTKVLNNFLTLVIFSMVVLNSKKFVALTKGAIR